MGATTFVKSSTPKVAVTQAEPHRPLKLRMDVPLFLIIVCMLAFGLVMLYSASWDFAVTHDMPSTSIFVKQLRLMGLGLIAAVVASMIDYHRYQRYILLLMAMTVTLLVLVLVFGRGDTGPARGLFGGSVQPSELSKLVIILYLSIWLYSKSDQIKSFKMGFIPVIFILGIMGGLILLQPDLSAAATVIVIGGLLFFLAGADWRQITIAMASTGLLGVIGLKLYSTGASRLQDYLAGLKDMTESSYHVMRAMEAVINGGWFGVGIGQANTKFTGLPFPYTDSIFAVIVEEMGLVGASLVVILFGLLLWRGLTIAKRAPDQLGSLLAAGLTLWIVLEAMLNMAVIIGLFPFAGNALPFFSAGGSNLVTSLVAIGILMNISKSNIHQEEKEGSAFSAIVDLRRWNGRRRVSRARRASNPVEQD
jgi:cell division protein FtsW